jgi:hypothetical protein
MPRGFPIVRAVLTSAMVGHWVANAVADPGEYARIGRQYAGDALHPILIQTGVVALLVTLMTLLARRRAPGGPSSARILGSAPLLGVLLGTQVSLVVLLEWTERVALGAPYAGAFGGGPFESGFIIELVLAAGSALLLVLLCAAAGRILKALLRTTVELAIADPQVRQPVVLEVARPVGALVGAGGERAPPS